MSKHKGRRVRSLEADYRSMTSDLKRVGGGIPDLTDTARGLSVMLDEKAPRARRTKFVTELMDRAGRITGAISHRGKMIQGRFAIMPMGTPGNLVGAGLLYFSREFVELERQAVTVRTKIMALKSNLNIASIEPLGEDTPINTDLHPTGVEKSWQAVAERAAILYRRKCIQFFAGVNPVEIRQGSFTTMPLDDDALSHLVEAMEHVYPNPAEVHTYISELEVNDKRSKQLVAVPYRQVSSEGKTLH